VPGGSTVPGDTTGGTSAPAWEGDRRINILLLGGDSGADRWSMRTDSMIVVSIDPVTGDAATISIPRNLPYI
jgi:anionic cell wall polymer biosynthesis LytR-Cps2A-Psr (LCP) family protein